jgi:hypothetical protein
MFQIFRKPQWSLDSLTPPWGGLGSIYDHIRLAPSSQPLPDEPLLRAKSKFGWIEGAMDGVVGHHFSNADSGQQVFELVEALRSLLQNASNNTLGNLYELIVRGSILSSIDAFLKELNQSMRSLDAGRLRETGRYFATRAGHREAVKFGLAVIGFVGMQDDLEVLKILGKNDEFTLYAAVAMARIAGNSEQALWDLAKNVHGWGRIQIVERLKETKNSEIQSWMLREGFRNEVMDEYLACICARAGRLHEALEQQVVDDALLEGAAEILRALIAGGGPAEGIDDYAQGADACESYANLVWTRSALGLKHFLTVATMRRFLSDPEGWDKREELGWTVSRRQTLQALCDDVFAREAWRMQVSEALSSSDEQSFYDADTSAKELSIDTWDVHFKRVRAAPLTSSSWYRLMQQTDEARIDSVLEFAESALPLRSVATGPADELGLGPGFEIHGTLDWILQDLRRFPLRRWKFIQAGLRSPVIRNRNMAIQALAAWPRESWTGEIASAVQRIRDLEPMDDVKRRLDNLVEGKPIG